MGLDMYFYARKTKFVSFSNYLEQQGRKDKTSYPKELQSFADGYKVKISNTYYKIGYFRKFNALHNYIVNNFADGIDECQEIVITSSNVKELIDILKLVLKKKDKAAEYLPTCEGFFFGCQEYNEFYFEDVQDALELFTKISENLDFAKYDLIYQASW